MDYLVVGDLECSKCRILKPFVYFHKDRYSKTGYTTQCKKCRLEKKKEWMQKPEVKERRAMQARVFRATKAGKRYTQKRNFIQANKKRFGGLRDVALWLSNERCKICDSSDKLCIHHIDGNGRGCENPNNKIDNLMVLCLSCHMRLHYHKRGGIK